MSLDEEALEAVANGGSIDLQKWAGIVAPLLERLEYIVYNVFPMPKLPGALNSQAFSRPPIPPNDVNSTPPESSNKENAAPGAPQSPPRTEGLASSSPSTERVPNSQPQSSAQQGNDSLPPPLALLLSSIRSAIQLFFVEKPPHTIQRLAELILRPTAHYKTLPAYLRAVDRVVSVTSGADIFPFNTPANSDQSNGLLHPTNSAGTYLTPDYAHGLGSDESLGGALLTPIPWLNTASFDGGDSSALEAAEDGHLQPQEADIATATVPAPTVEGEEAATSGSPPAESDEVPHARGPSLLGVEDMGLQDGKGVEMNLEAQQAAAADDVAEGSGTPQAQADGESARADKDGDIVLDDTSLKEASKTEDSPQTEKSETASNAVQSAESKE
ncbi:uncharacterized protein N7484_011184 [Penicillium longicatenatum]|uniref:uncharacterized protein n=1 Tax=Penicillium longicatenatum TaxID=1561947 RepID=UPI0025473F1F|nr:uncharacterized protein N7484_011184 [Penicillium longicatenatum]KAJ5631084.1 hypothetical protein N7484_011184 [Penicillium longicatenatum]